MIHRNKAFLAAIAFGSALTAALSVAAAQDEDERPKQITKEEATARAAERFDRMDKDDDGFVTPEELEASLIERAERADSRQDRFNEIRENRAQEAFATADTNQDGVVSLEEQLAQAESRFEALDRNDDEVLTRREMRKARDAKKRNRAQQD